MPNFSLEIRGALIELTIVLDKPYLKIPVNRFIKALKNMELLDEYIMNIKSDKFMNIEAIKIQKTKQKTQ